MKSEFFPELKLLDCPKNFRVKEIHRFVELLSAAG